MKLLTSRKRQDSPILRKHMPELDAVRGVAILAVVLYHGFYTSFPNHQGSTPMRVVMRITHFGWSGVDLFFVLSGFLISGILLDGKNKRTSKFYRDFYYRRALRILPVFYAFLLAVAVISLREKTATFGYLALSAVYIANFAPYLGYDAHFAVSVIWSLAIEEQFYLVWPTIIKFAKERVVLAVSVVLLVACPILRGAMYTWTRGTDFGFSITPMRLDGFAWGALLAITLRKNPNSTKALIEYALATLGVGVICIVGGWSMGIMTRKSLIGAMFQITAFESLYAALLAIALAVGSGRLVHIAPPRVLSFFGKISYCLYLIHQLAFYFYDMHFRIRVVTDRAIAIRFGVVFCVCCTLATLSYYFFESPILKLKERLNRVVEVAR